MLNSIQNDKHSFVNHEQQSVDSIYQSDQANHQNGPGVQSQRWATRPKYDNFKPQKNQQMSQTLQANLNKGKFVTQSDNENIQK